MTRLIATLRTRLDQRARYKRTLRELRRMSLDTALDLDIYRRYAYRRTLYTLRNLPERTRMDCDIAGHENEIARRAVYGA